MNFIQIAERIIRYFQANRGCGHTKAVTHGAIGAKANIVVETEAELDTALRGVHGDKLVSLSEIEAGELDKDAVRGFPLVFDNGAVTGLLLGLLSEIDALKHKLAETQKAKKAKDGEAKP